MISRRNLILRLSVTFNVIVVVYVALQMPGRGGVSFEEHSPSSNIGVALPQSSSGRNLASIDSGDSEPGTHPPVELATTRPVLVATSPSPTASHCQQEGPLHTLPHSPPQKSPLAISLGCADRKLVAKYLQRGDHWVLLNYVRADRTFSCAESVTYTTHGDFSFLDNLPALLDRWRGPVSLALFAPGEDFARTMEAIAYARSCTSPLVRELVTFHIYFGVKDVPSKVRWVGEDLPEYDCTGHSAPIPWGNQGGNGTVTYTSYKSRKNLLYPVNVGRNIAREAATTHYVLPSDIELYPSPGLIDAFLDLILRERQNAVTPSLTTNSSAEVHKADSLPKQPLMTKRVYVLPIFEIAANMSQPETKQELVRMLKNKTAIPFHKNVCTGCHAVPKAKEWEAAAASDDWQEKPLGVFHVGKRVGSYHHWEPIYIGTDEEPPYDERLSWEGKSDKMTQGYALCALDYEFRILDNAFLVHRPGIKMFKNDPKRSALAAKTNTLIRKFIAHELKVLYGIRKGCLV